MRTRVITAIVIVLTASNALFGATIIFSEDFESYAPGSNLVGQGGWTGLPDSGAVLIGPTTVTIDPGVLLTTSGQVMNGRALTGPGQQNFADHFIPINPSAITTLLFDAYAVEGSSHNQVISFLGDGDEVEWSYDEVFEKWYFLPSTFPDVYVDGGLDMKVKLGIVLDGEAHETYGLYDFGSGLTETPHFPLSPALHATIDRLYIMVDHRGGFDGIEVDNLIVTEIPEPASLSLLALGGAALLRRKRN